MKKSSVKSDLLSIAEKMPDTATYAEAMYELYVLMKIDQGRGAGEADKFVSHEQVKRQFADN